MHSKENNRVLVNDGLVQWDAVGFSVGWMFLRKERSTI